MSNKTIEMEYAWKYNKLWPYNGMVNDLWRGVQAEENYLVALGLFVYSEILGRMILGTIGENGGGSVAFREFTERYIGYSFVNDAEWKEVFDKYRNGFAHEFYIKELRSAVYNEKGSASCGIDISQKPYKLCIHSYFIHFSKGLEKAIDLGVLK